MPRAATTSDTFNAIAEPRRRDILDYLAVRERSVGEIVIALNLPQPSVSKHLGVLRGVGLVDVRREGRQFIAETDLWKMITGVMRRRERAQVDDAIERVAKIVASLEAVEDPSPAIAFARARMVQLHDFFELGRRFLDAFVAKNRLSGLLSTIAQRAAKFPSLLRHWGHDVRVE